MGDHMNPIRKMIIKHFRGLTEQELDFEGRALNAIVGQNASMKTTILGMIASSFAIKSSEMADEKMIDGNGYGIVLDEKFKFSNDYDIPGSHEWSLELNRRLSNDSFSMKSYLRSSGKLRFWMPGARKKGDSLIQCPSVYMSLKRLSPLGEEDELKYLSENMTDEEKTLYRKWHNEILISTDHIDDMTIIKSSTKTTIAPKSNYYDGVAISAGQDNIGKIILGVLSIKRIKEKHKNVYKGSVFCIDELESTLYPASQIKMVSFLKKVSEEYSIQFFFTTHSMTIIRALYAKELDKFVSINYAKKVGAEVRIYHDVKLNQIEKDLYLNINLEGVDNRIKVYCEDTVGMTFTKYFVGNRFTQKEHLSYQNLNGLNIGKSNYLHLLKSKIPEFLNSIIVLDGDVRCNDTEYKRAKQYKNVVILPTDDYPERIVYDCFIALSETDCFWDNRPGGFTKQACFMDYTDENLSQSEIKNWFKTLNGKKGKGYTQFISKTFETKIAEKQQFIDDFISAYDYVYSKKM